MSHLREIENHFGRPITKLDTDDFDKMERAVAS